MARPKRGEILSLTIDDLAFGGEGVGRADGYVVFVPGGLPGDRLRVRLVQVRSRFGRGVIESVEAPSPQRVEAPCPYFGRCGGCRLQHVAYGAQLAFKSKQVADALERLGGLKGVDLRPIIGAEETFGYRNKMEFTVARPRGQGPPPPPPPPRGGGGGGGGGGPEASPLTPALSPAGRGSRSSSGCTRPTATTRCSTSSAASCSRTG
jgi:predicted RNA-binding protein with TRAM domain